MWSNILSNAKICNSKAWKQYKQTHKNTDLNHDYTLAMGKHTLSNNRALNDPLNDNGKDSLIEEKLRQLTLTDI